MGGGLIASVPQVIGFRVPVGGFLGKVANGIVQGTAAGGVVFAGFVLSGYAVNAVDAKMKKADGTAVLGKFQRPVLFGAVAGVMGGIMRFGAKFVKGNPLLWTILGAAGPGLAAVASLIDATMDKQKSADSGGIIYRLNKIATGLADYIQVGDDAIEAGVGDAGGAIEAGVGDDGVGDFIQVGEPDYNVAEDVA